MLKVGLIGIGFMGRGHLDNYIRLQSEGYPVKLEAICDIDEKKFKGEFIPGNLDFGAGKYDFTQYRLYTNMDEMLEKEDLDYVDIALPTYLHAEASIKALNKGIHVLCEKPMALTVDDCMEMIDAARKNHRKLMIGQCLRFWPEYEILKQYVESREYGTVLSGYFYRGGSTPKWSYKNWLITKEKSGGCLLDQHVHDIDMINWLFGKPKKVSSMARNVIAGSGYDIVSTHYVYDDNKVINAQDDWTLGGAYGFKMGFRVNFEKANIIYENNMLKVNPNEGEAFVPECSTDSGYYREIKYFIDSIMQDYSINVANPESTMQTIRIAEAELHSADNNGDIVSL